MSVSVCVQVEILPDSKLLQPTQTNPEQNRPIQTYSVPFGPISPIQSYSVLLSAKVLQFEQLPRTSQCLFLNLMNTTTTTKIILLDRFGWTRQTDFPLSDQRISCRSRSSETLLLGSPQPKVTLSPSTLPLESLAFGALSNFENRTQGTRVFEVMNLKVEWYW